MAPAPKKSAASKTQPARARKNAKKPITPKPKPVMDQPTSLADADGPMILIEHCTS